mmetsp:Transcript_7541/g.21012  ORF Transcript_7541/g.21012 Transcript_7541/m.21012 type:complete len:148 (+) Transcript_7541:637-1080(+)
MLYSQWFQGKLNVEADSLSRDTNLTDDELTNFTHIFSRMPASTKFQGCPTPEQDHLLAYLTVAELARQEAITEATNEKHALAWKRWQTFLESIGIDDDPFLDSFDLRWDARKLWTGARSGRVPWESQLRPPTPKATRWRRSDLPSCA